MSVARLRRYLGVWVALVLFCACGAALAAASTNQLWQMSIDGTLRGSYASYGEAYAGLNTFAGNPWQVCSGTVSVVLRKNLDTCAIPRGAIVLVSAHCPDGESLSGDWLTCSVASASPSDPVGVLGLKISDLLAALMIGVLVLVYGAGLAVGQQR